jgi:hypothetical protein
MTIYRLPETNDRLPGFAWRQLATGVWQPRQSEHRAHSSTRGRDQGGVNSLRRFRISDCLRIALDEGDLLRCNSPASRQ